MNLISLILLLAVIGFILWLITTYIPMPEPFKKVIIVVIVIVLIIYMLQLFGITGNLPSPKVGSMASFPHLT